MYCGMAPIQKRVYAFVAGPETSTCVFDFHLIAGNSWGRISHRSGVAPWFRDFAREDCMRFYNAMPFYEIQGEDQEALSIALETRSFRFLKLIRFHKFLGGWTVYVMLWKSSRENIDKYYFLKI